MAEQLRKRRLAKRLTQEGLANRAGVSLASLRKFEQKGQVSLVSFLKMASVLDCLPDLVKATELPDTAFESIEEVLQEKKTKTPQRGSRK